MMEGYPEKGEFVIATVESVNDHGAFVKLDEYENKQGIVSLREFSQKWVKNPRDYLREGQKTVLKVLRINMERGHIDLTLKEVSESDKKNKLKDYKLNIRVEKFMGHLAGALKKKESEVYTLFGDKLIEDYGNLYEALSNVSNDKEDLKKYIKDDKLRQEIIKLTKESIKPTYVTIHGFVTMSSREGDGVERIRSALLAGEKILGDMPSSGISYVSPPNYRIEITADDYKNAERKMRECYEAIEKYASSKGIKSEFLRELKKPAA